MKSIDVSVTLPTKPQLVPGQLWVRTSGIYAGHVYLAVKRFDSTSKEVMLVDTSNFNERYAHEGFGESPDTWEYCGTLNIKELK